MSAFPENHSHDAEFLLDQFYQWEMRGRGWAKWDAPVELEPPFRPFEGHSLPVRRYRDDGIQETRLSRFAARFLGLGTPKQETPEPAQIEIEEPPPEYLGKREELVELHVSLPSDYEASHDVFEQCLFGLGYCRGALAFEVIGASDGIVAQLVCERGDEEAVRTQFKSHFPEAVIEPIAGHLLGRWSEHETKSAEILEFGLEREFMLSLNSSCDLAIDPLVAVCGALEKLRAGEAGVFQVLFQPVRDAWSESIWRAVTTEDGGSFFDGAPEFVKQTGQKLARPLFSAVVRVAAKSPSAERTLQIIRGLAGALKLFANSTGNALVPLENDGYPDDAHEADLLGRVSRRSGMLLNSDELVSLAHLPTAAVRSRKLKRATKRSKEPPLIAIGEGIVLGENVHEGRVMPITLKPYQRVRHMHVVGATGTGKSTLLLNLIGQDIAAGQGVGVIDPHGDLIDQVLCRVPPERFDDVIIFDASDEDYPIGFNVLSAHSSLERNLLASDLVAVFRRLSTSWGDQMNSVLANAILAFLESSNGGTVADLRRFLLEPAFRTQFLGTVEDREVRYYWERAFPTLKTNSVGPLLTRLDTFLRPKAIRYMVSQQANKLDFAAILNQGKIFLAKLSEGFVGEENAFLLGTLLVAKFHQLAISRQEMEESERRPFYLYLDEFHHFATPSMAKILSGVRKYQLGLVLAHHGAAQLQWSPELASAVLSHPYTRVCFRVGDEDARKLADGFSFFETRDFQNLDIGEAICRMERADFDFNVRIPLPPPVDRAEAARIRAELVTRSRQKYATPRQEVEDALAKDWDDDDPVARDNIGIDCRAATAASGRSQNTKTCDCKIGNAGSRGHRWRPASEYSTAHRDCREGLALSR